MEKCFASTLGGFWQVQRETLSVQRPRFALLGVALSCTPARQYAQSTHNQGESVRLQYMLAGSPQSSLQAASRGIFKTDFIGSRLIDGLTRSVNAQIRLLACPRGMFLTLVCSYASSIHNYQLSIFFAAEIGHTGLFPLVLCHAYSAKRVSVSLCSWQSRPDGFSSFFGSQGQKEKGHVSAGVSRRGPLWGALTGQTNMARSKLPERRKSDASCLFSAVRSRFQGRNTSKPRPSKYISSASVSSSTGFPPLFSRDCLALVGSLPGEKTQCLNVEFALCEQESEVQHG